MKLIKEILNEKWKQEVSVSPHEKGKYKDVTIAELKARLKKATTKEERGELMFAIRAKQKDKWGKINESQQLDEGMPSAVVMAKSKFAELSDKEIADHFHNKAAQSPAKTFGKDKGKKMTARDWAEERQRLHGIKNNRYVNAVDKHPLTEGLEGLKPDEQTEWKKARKGLVEATINLEDAMRALNKVKISEVKAHTDTIKKLIREIELLGNRLS